MHDLFSRPGVCIIVYAPFCCNCAGPSHESEGNDRRDMKLPGVQEQLLMDAIKYGQDSMYIVFSFFIFDLRFSYICLAS